MAEPSAAALPGNPRGRRASLLPGSIRGGNRGRASGNMRVLPARILPQCTENGRIVLTLLATFAAGLLAYLVTADAPKPSDSWDDLGSRKIPNSKQGSLPNTFSMSKQSSPPNTFLLDKWRGI